MEALLSTWGQGPFVFISSVSVYGRSRWVPTTEEHPLDDQSSYGRGKIDCETLLTEYARQKGRTDFSILRPPHIWAPDLRCLRHRASSTTELYARIRAGAPIVLPGRTQDQWSGYGDDWVDARELAWAAAECLAHPLGEAANAINGYFTWHDFCAELIRLTGSSSNLEHTDLDAITEQDLAHKDFFAQNWRYSGRRLEQRLGFRPRYRWQATLAQVVERDQ
jgi:nucleoside-diphosphate-sugar epimerase